MNVENPLPVRYRQGMRPAALCGRIAESMKAQSNIVSSRRIIPTLSHFL